MGLLGCLSLGVVFFAIIVILASLSESFAYRFGEPWQSIFPEAKPLIQQVGGRVVLYTREPRCMDYALLRIDLGFCSVCMLRERRQRFIDVSSEATNGTVFLDDITSFLQGIEFADDFAGAAKWILANQEPLKKWATADAGSDAFRNHCERRRIWPSRATV